MRTIIPLLSAVCACLLAPGDAGAQTPFTVGIVHGVRPGPVLVLTVGVHGQEYTPILTAIGMREEGPSPVAQPVWIERSEVLRSSGTGIFSPSVERGHTVAKDTLIGRVTDFHGRVIEEIRAPFAGEVLYVLGTPAISKGEPVAFIGSTAER